MRKNIISFFILVFIFFVFNGISLAQTNQLWKWMHPKPQGNGLRYVKAINSTTWYAVGYAGTFMKTTNSGSTWAISTNAGGYQSSGQGKILYSGWFFDANTGIVCGASGWIGRTTNGGTSWDSIATSATSTLYGIHFINSTTGFIGGLSGKVLKTINAGLTWTDVSTGGTASIYNIFALDVNYIYCPLSSGGNLLYTTNGGTNWTTVATGGSTMYDANFISTSVGFVCGSSGNVRKTVNGGLGWTGVNVPVTTSQYELRTVVGGLVPSVPYSEGFESVTFPPTGWRAVSDVGTVVWVRNTAQFHSGAASAFINYDCGTGGGLDWLFTPQWAIMSGDSLSFWMRTNDNGYIPDSVAVRVSTTDTARASFTTRILYLAEGTNYPPAATWKRYAVSLNAFAGQNIYIAFKHGNNCGDGVFLDDIAVNRLSASVDLFVVGDAMNIYRSSNLGANWTAINHLDPSQPWTSTWYSMDISGTNHIAVGGNGLFNKSTNNGANWTTLTTWLSAGTFYDVWAEHNDKKVWAVGSPGSSGSTFDQILHSTNGGITWVNQAINSTRYFRSISMINASTGYIAGSSGAVRKTTNGGTSWDSLPFPSTSLLYKAEFVNASTGWVGGSSSPYIWKTTDGGLTWASQTGPTATVYSIDMIDANTGWLSGSSGSIRKTTDGGATWTAQTTGTTSTLYDVKMLDANTGFFCGSSSAVFKTTNSGANWVSIAQPYSTTLYSIDWYNVNNGIVAGSSGYTSVTHNGGNSWSIENTSGSTMYGLHMCYVDSAWAVGSGPYVFKLSTGIVGVTNYNNNIPSVYYLAQNYPNPFNPKTTIKFGLPKAGSVTLNVYDITGRLVRSILNNAPLNAGTVTHNFDGTNLASGIYFYTLIIDNEKFDTKKMIVVK